MQKSLKIAEFCLTSEGPGFESLCFHRETGRSLHRNPFLHLRPLHRLHTRRFSDPAFPACRFAFMLGTNVRSEQRTLSSPDFSPSMHERPTALLQAYAQKHEPPRSASGRRPTKLQKRPYSRQSITKHTVSEDAAAARRAVQT